MVAFDDVQPVKGFVDEQNVGAGRQRENQRRLPFHALAHGVNGLFAVGFKLFGKRSVQFSVKSWPRTLAELRHAVHAAAGQKVEVVRHIDEIPPHAGAVGDVLAVDGDGAAVGAVHTRHYPHERGLARADGTDQSEDAAGLHRQVHIVHRGEIVEFFGDINRVYHFIIRQSFP